MAKDLAKKHCQKGTSAIERFEWLTSAIAATVWGQNWLHRWPSSRPLLAWHWAWLKEWGGFFPGFWSCNFTRCPPLSFWLWEIWKSRGLNSKQNSILLRFHALHSTHALRVSGKHTNMKAGWNSSCETAPFPTFVVKFIGRPLLQTSTPKFRSISTAANLENHLYASLNPWL